MRIRGFEVVSTHKGKGINLPRRKTKKSAAYDLEAAANVTVPPGPGGKAVVPTGIKAYMQDDEVLKVHVRSGVSFKNTVSLLNDVGVIDADYYNNPDNEGHILVGIVNHTHAPVHIKKGERVAQAIFEKYLLADGDDAEGERNGGIGSTGK
ncbi:MAG TPA: deoxyuridine 5'-triphosphate nucleotidohydrolase [Nitrospiraceae bacterium]|nr:deoxyuridine 5'-triphosphate nucleotidohydrolase [Nitrospiraceae bacterium]